MNTVTKRVTFHGIPRESATKWVQEAVAPVEETVERQLMYIHGFEIDKDRIRIVKLIDAGNTCDIEIVLNPPSTPSQNEGTTRFEDYTISGEQVKFGIALEALKNGFRVRRESWAPDTFIYFVPGSQFVVNRAPLLGIYPEGTEIVYAPHIDIKSGANHCQVWQVSHDSILADDWIICMRGA